MILTPTQKLLWEQKWRDLCEHAALQNLERQPGDPLFGASIPQLMGTDPMADPCLQACLDPDILRITLTGLFVLPGIIDADYNGQIQATAWTLSPPLSIPKGSRIARLIFFRAVVPKAVDAIRGAAGFGSTGFPKAFWAANIAQHRPMLTVTLA
uniref:dUTPase-like domain-containing protein n=1 Tax=Anser cygnoides TaxID=8845 RepID=A0A8B9E565_ANSCY